MMLEMIFRLLFTISSFFITVLLYIVYFSKRFKLKLRNKLYIYLLMTSVGVIITEFISNCYFAIGDNQIIYRVLVFFQGGFVLLWSFLLMTYLYCLIFNRNYPKILDLPKNDKLISKYAIFTGVILILYAFLPTYSLNSTAINFMPGISAYMSIAHYALTLIIIIGLLIKNIKNISFKDMIIISLILIIVPLVSFIMEFFTDMAFIGFVNSLQMLFIYFYYENPDLFMIEEIEKLTAQTEKISKIKADFLSNMSHEIRSPMNAIMGFSETILNDSEFDKERVINDIEIIESSSKNLLEIINNILDISKIESNQDTLEEKDYSFSKIVKDLNAIAQTRIGDKPIKLIFDIEEGIPDRLHGDSTKIFQVVLNILTNAVKYTEVGRINVDIDKEIVDNQVLLSIKVADTGYGIKKEDFDKMFEKFSRLDEAKTNEIEGTGLGLVITKRYVDLMKGKIWFESQYGVGTTFYLEIPQIISEDQTALEEENNKQEAKHEVQDLSRFKVLIVDDNKLNIKVAQRLLTNYNFTVDTCMSGKDCIFKFKQGTHYDLIFMDHMMPEMDGIETFHILRKLEGYYQPPIIALTANAVAGAREMYLKEGFDDYVSKPISTKELDRVIDKFILRK